LKTCLQKFHLQAWYDCEQFEQTDQFVYINPMQSYKALELGILYRNGASGFLWQHCKPSRTKVSVIITLSYFSFHPSVTIWDFWQCWQHILEQIWRNVIQQVIYKNFSSNIFPSLP
jgi:hypothetical protein